MNIFLPFHIKLRPIIETDAVRKAKKFVADNPTLYRSMLIGRIKIRKQ